MEVSPGQRWGGTTNANPGIFYSNFNGSSWSTPLRISENTGFAEIPHIAVDSTDTIHVVWDDETYGEHGRIAYKTRSSSGTWSSIETLPLSSGTAFAWNARIAADNTNIPHVVFSGGTTGVGDSIYWSQKVGGTWSTPDLISKNVADSTITDTQWSDLTRDGNGNLHVIYQSWGQGIFYRKYSGGSWSVPFQVKAGGGYTRVAATTMGEVFVTWEEQGSVRVRWTQNGVWQSENILTTLAQNTFWGFPIMGITSDSQERVYVTFLERDPIDGQIDLKYRMFELGTWGSTQDVDLDNNDADEPVVYVDSSDNLHFFWTERNATTGLWEIFYSIIQVNQPPTADAGPNQTVVVNNLVTLDGSESSDPEGATLTYLWSEDVGNPQTGILSNTTAVNPTFTPSIAGVYQFTLVVNDGFMDSAPDTVVITVQTPAEAIQDLIDTVGEFNLQQGIDNSLDAKLDAALQALGDINQNNDVAAINSLQSFINAVEAQRGNQITNEQADKLVARAQAIIDSLSTP